VAASDDEREKRFELLVLAELDRRSMCGVVLAVRCVPEGCPVVVATRDLAAELERHAAAPCWLVASCRTTVGQLIRTAARRQRERAMLQGVQ
jgi:hypothetical protein